MPLVSFFFIFFGITVIAYPAFISYIIGIFFIMIGSGPIFLWLLARNSQQSHKSWSFGNYEIIKKK